MTTLTRTNVVNIALAHLGDHRIEAWEDDSPSASDARDQWELARLMALSAYEWAFASRVTKLGQNATAPVASWEYRYDQPVKFIRVNRMSDSDSFDSSYPFRAWDYREGFFETNATELYCDHVYDHETVGAWPPWFVEYMGVELAFRINPKITTSQSHGQTLDQMRDKILHKARARDANLQPIRQVPNGRWYRSMRGGGINTFRGYR